MNGGSNEKKTKKIIEEMVLICYDDDFKKEVIINPNAFSRNRKLGFVKIILLILNTLRRTLQTELDNFIKRIEKSDELYTKQSFCESRQKLKAKAFIILNDRFIKTYYSEEHKKIKEYLILAIDGSDFEIPNEKKLVEIYGYAGNAKEDSHVGKAKASMLYDVENEIVISAILNRYDSSERDLAIKNIQKYKELMGNKKAIITMDRGYPSIGMMLYIEQNNLKYVMRVSKSFCKEISKITAQDSVIELNLTNNMIKNAKNLSSDIEIPVTKKMKTRVIKIILDGGEIETLVTNCNIA